MFAIWRANNAKYLLITVRFAVWRPLKCKKPCNYCVFCNHGAPFRRRSRVTTVCFAIAVCPSDAEAI